MLVGHAVADTYLQPGWLSQLKRDPELRIKLTALAVHGFAHCIPVAVATRSPLLTLAEFVLHPLIDHLKARGWYGMYVDQTLHVLCKVAWVAVVLQWS